MVYSLSYFSFQPVLHNWCNKDSDMFYPVLGMVHIKETLLLIKKSSPYGSSSEFPLSSSESSFTTYLTLYNRKIKCAECVVKQNIPLPSCMLYYLIFAIRIEVKIDSLNMLGTGQNGVKPKMIKSHIQDAKNQVYSLLDAKVETNPLDGGADTRIQLSARPLEITYDAVSRDNVRCSK